MDNREPIHSIWGKFLSGDKEAFAFLYNNHINSLYRYGTKICKDESLVKDAIQEIFIELYTKRNKNRTNPENIKFYLFLALKRNLIKKITRIREFSGFSYSRSLIFEPEYSIEKKIIEDEKEEELQSMILESLKKLPSKQKEAVFLRFNESLEYNEISKILNITVESSRKQVYRALKTLKKLLKKQMVVLWLLFPYKIMK